MRVAFVTDSYKPKIGGIESVVRDMALTLREDHEIFVITSSKDVVGGYRVEDDDGITVIRVNAGVLYFGGVTLNPLSFMLAYKIFKDVEPDLVHGHGLFSTLSIMGALISEKMLRRPAILTAHSFLGKDSPLYLVETLNIVSKRVSLLTAVSKATLMEIAKRLRPRRVMLTYNCIRVSEWLEDESVELEGDPVIVSSLRLTHRKNPVVLIRVAEYLRTHAPTARIYVIGDGILRRPLESRVKARKLSNIKFLGAMSRESLKKVLKGADIFVLPSKLEAFGISALEAMASGLPVVAMNSGGIPEIVVDGKTGLLAKNEEDFAKKVLELSLDLAMAREMGKRALERALFFDCKRISKMYLRAYDVALSCSGSPQ